MFWLRGTVFEQEILPFLDSSGEWRKEGPTTASRPGRNRIARGRCSKTRAGGRAGGPVSYSCTRPGGGPAWVQAGAVGRVAAPDGRGEPDLLVRHLHVRPIEARPKEMTCR